MSSAGALARRAVSGLGKRRRAGARVSGGQKAAAGRCGCLGPTVAWVLEGPRFVIVFVSESSEFVIPVPLPLSPPAGWEEEGECSLLKF